MIDTKGWHIKTKSLTDYEKIGWVEDHFVETEDKKYGVYIYNIIEWRMGAYTAQFALFSGKPKPTLFSRKAKPTLILNSPKNLIEFNFENTVDYAPKSSCLILKIIASGKFNFPFLFIKPEEKVFAFIKWDSSSIYYGFNEIEKDKIALRETAPRELRMTNQNREGEIFDISNLTWFDLANFDNLLAIYEKMA